MWVDGLVGDAPVRFRLDTGAADCVVPLLDSTQRPTVTGVDSGVAEPVKGFETRAGYLFWMLASREGSLIQATVGSLGGAGRRPRNRSGFAA